MNSKEKEYLVEEGMRHFHKQHFLTALEFFLDALVLDANDPQLNFHAGVCLRHLNKNEVALPHFKRALFLSPHMYEAESNIGLIYLESGESQLSEEIFKKLPKAYPEELSFKLNWALALKKLGDFSKALSLLLELQIHSNDDPAPLINLGELYMEMGEESQAKICLEKAVSLFPENWSAHVNLAHSHLILGEFIEGWKEFEWRLRDPSKKFHRFESPDRFSKPRWDGPPLAGRVLLLVAEEGLGDTLMWSRFIPLLPQDGKILLECQPRMKKILKSLKSPIEIFNRGEKLPPYDFYLPLMSLTDLLKIDAPHLPGPIPYLFADEKLSEEWRSWLAPTKGLKVGLAWQGNRSYLKDSERSIPFAFMPHLPRHPNLHWFCLQKDASAEEIKDFPFTLLPNVLDAHSDAFLESGALLMNLDLLITSDSAIAHLAGALGRPTWLLLPQNPNWRWLLHREDSLWYPTVKIFRQPARGDWDSVMVNVRVELESKINDFEAQ